jgi:hypothetical protein
MDHCACRSICHGASPFGAFVVLRSKWDKVIAATSGSATREKDDDNIL